LASIVGWDSYSDLCSLEEFVHKDKWDFCGEIFGHLIRRKASLILFTVSFIFY
jgi:hypothetical protein